MNEPSSPLSNNKLRRMQAWARNVFPGNWHPRCAAVSTFLAELSEDEREELLRQSWAEVFATAERERPEAFAQWQTAAAQSA